MRTIEVERLYRELQRRVDALPDARRQALKRKLSTMNEGPVTTLLKRTIEKSGRTPCSIAREAGLDTAAMYRFLSGERQLKSGSIDRLCDVLNLQLTPKATASQKHKAR